MDRDYRNIGLNTAVCGVGEARSTKEPAFNGLLRRLEKAISVIDEKTKEFQLVLPMGEQTEPNKPMSEFERELTEMVNFAETVASKIDL